MSSRACGRGGGGCRGGDSGQWLVTLDENGDEKKHKVYYGPNGPYTMEKGKRVLIDDKAAKPKRKSKSKKRNDNKQKPKKKKGGVKRKANPSKPKKAPKKARPSSYSYSCSSSSSDDDDGSDDDNVDPDLLTGMRLKNGECHCDDCEHDRHGPTRHTPDNYCPDCRCIPCCCCD